MICPKVCWNIYQNTPRRFIERLSTALGTNMRKTKNGRTGWPGVRSKINMRRMNPAGNGKLWIRTKTGKVKVSLQAERVSPVSVSYTHLRAHETVLDLV